MEVTGLPSDHALRGTVPRSEDCAAVSHLPRPEHSLKLNLTLLRAMTQDDFWRLIDRINRKAVGAKATPVAAGIRAELKMAQTEFADLLSVGVRTAQD